MDKTNIQIPLSLSSPKKLVEKSMVLVFMIIVFFTMFAMFAMNTHGKLNQVREGKRNIQTAKDLFEQKMYFSSIVYLKEALAEGVGPRGAEFDLLVDSLISKVGVRQFESLSTTLLERSKAPTIRYIQSKKLFRTGKYEEALKVIDRNLSEDHPIKPFSLMLEASIYAILKKTEDAVRVFDECIFQADRQLDKIEEAESEKSRLRQLKITKDYCIIGKPRAYFAGHDFDKAYSLYVDFEKKSYIWPEILFEEAWNSFYLKDFNRTLGKLVTYKAPVFSYIFNPEIDVLNALTYMEMCLWKDSKKVVDQFYTQYEANFDDYKKFLEQLGRDYRQYYMLVKDYKDEKIKVNDLIGNALSSISRDPSYVELFDAFNLGKDEIERLKDIKDQNFRNSLSVSLKESLTLQRNLIGSYIRSQLKLFENQMIRSFEDMSYIKLEILAKRKSEIYDEFSSTESSRERGDIIHLKRTDKQYFWNFNGEFWADELGDYVFSLKNECRVY